MILGRRQCPFCGIPPEGTSRVKNKQTGRVYFNVVCQGCKARGPRIFLIPGRTEVEASMMATKAWNERRRTSR